ncbi:MAG TPA: hypothetical protein PLF71_04685, partial [bacterium]|nr:hypothetical protein [bacterium]
SVIPMKMGIHEAQDMDPRVREDDKHQSFPLIPPSLPLTLSVIPMKMGIHEAQDMDPRLREDDNPLSFP